MEKLEKSFESLNKKMTKMMEDIKCIKESQEFMSKKYDELFADLKKIKSDQKIAYSNNKALKEEVKDLKEKVDALERDKLRNDIEIVGIPDLANEDLKGVIVKVAEQMDCKIQLRDIKECFRVGKEPRDERPRVVVVKLPDEVLKEKLLKASKINARKLATAKTQLSKRIYIKLKAC